MAEFFFSSRRRHTRWPRDWSSDVCSSDLELFAILRMWSFFDQSDRVRQNQNAETTRLLIRVNDLDRLALRSEERRVGKECRSRGWPEHSRKKAKEVTRATESTVVCVVSWR